MTRSRKKKPETYNRLMVVVKDILAREETLIYIQNLERSFKPFKPSVNTADEFWILLDTLKRKSYESRSMDEYAVLKEIHDLDTYIEKLYGGIFDTNFNVLLASYILFKKFPKKHRFMGVEMRIVRPNAEEGTEIYVEIILKASAIQREVIAFIKQNWDEISTSTNQGIFTDKLARMAYSSNAILLKKQRPKTTLERNKRILQLRNKGETYKEIQSVLAFEKFGRVTFDTIRKVVSKK